MSVFATTHARALEQVRAKGAPVTFRRERLDYDPLTGARTTQVTTVAGAAIRTTPRSMNDFERMRGAGLVLKKAVMLLWAPEVFGEKPEPGDTTTWNGIALTVREVDPVAPDGPAILCRVLGEA